MKESIKSILILSTLILINCSLSFAQDFERIDRRKIIKLSNESTQAEIKVRVSKEHDFVAVWIKGIFDAGETEIALIKPNGDATGTMTAINDIDISKGDNTDVKEKVMVRMIQNLEDPLPGDWIIYITPTKSTGEIYINTTHMKNPKKDDLREFIDEEESISGGL